jgi:Cu-Zn family superoxide dismutase
MKNTNSRRVMIGAIALGVAGVVQLTSGPASATAHPLARAGLANSAGTEIGRVTFKGEGRYANQIVVELNSPTAPGLGGFHGIHIHSIGVCDSAPSGATSVPFGSAGGHWNPTGTAHGAHVGDLPSVLLTSGGGTYARFETDRFDVTALLDTAGDGSAVVLHAGPDNFANIPATYGEANTATLATGDAGGRYACGVVKLVK